MTIDTSAKIAVSYFCSLLLTAVAAYGWLKDEFAESKVRQLTTDAKVEALLKQQAGLWTRSDMALWQEMFARLNPTLAVPKIPERQ